MLRTLIDRQLVLDYLQARSRGASQQEVDLEIKRWTKTFASRGMTLAEYYEGSGMDEAALRRLFAWKIGWFRFVDKQLTASRLEKYFADHQRDFDGTRIHVAHILWRTTPAEIDDRVQEAARVRQAILEGKESFETAARSLSQAPSAPEGGDLGWLERQGTMHPAFLDAAFQLDVDEISPPVVTPAGVHLIRCLEVQPGERSLRDVREQVILSATQRLFRNLAGRQSKSARIEIVPHAERP